MDDNKKTVCIVSVCISACYIAYVAITKADGAVFASVVGALSALAGFEIKKAVDKIKKS